MKSFIFNIDLLGACNLSCPSCPVGNTETRNPQGFMSLDLMEQIIIKAKSECKIVNFELFNWTEPLLHPKIVDMINLVQSHGIKCDLSSNLNRLVNSNDLMKANPFRFRISCSGFTQPVYGKTHRGGNIEVVKQNMKVLAEARDRNKASTLIHVFYHRYRHNIEEEPLMREFAEDLGFQFLTCWAAMMPVEKVIRYGKYGRMDNDDIELVNLLLLPLDKALKIGKKKQNESCLLQTSKISLDYRGNVTLCCGIYNNTEFRIGNYLDIPIEEIQKKRQQHVLCGSCMSSGTQSYITNNDKAYDEAALSNVDTTGDFVYLKKELSKNKFRKMLEGVSRKLLTVEQSAYMGSLYDKVRASI